MEIFRVRQLMALEAIRMHVALHGLPTASLRELHPVSALPNPFDETAVVYKAVEEAAAWH